MKLEFKHLVGYSPYDLKWSLQGLRLFTMTGITKETLFTKEGTVLNWAKHQDLPQSLFPILRPLSDLTKEIEVNGEEFIPIVELARLADVDISDLYPAFYNDNESYGVRFNIENDDDDYSHVIFAYDCYNTFGIHKRRFDNDNNGDILHCPNQLQIWNKLYEWHFDVHNLISEDLAIDVNTL